jgi:antirestriction protein ArdC
MKKLRHDVARRDHYEELTNTIIAKLENGVLPGGGLGTPRNAPQARAR